MTDDIVVHPRQVSGALLDRRLAVWCAGLAGVASATAIAILSSPA